MTTRLVAGGRSGEHTSLLLLAGGAALTVFYYFARADTIGVSGLGHLWSPMTRPGLPIGLHWAGALLLLGLLPVLAARRLIGLSWRALGLGVGAWRQGLALVAIGAPLAMVAGYLGSRSAAMRAVYPLDPGFAESRFALYAALQALYFGPWEVLFRGVLLFGTRQRWGDSGANALQTALSVTAHFGRAMNETIAAFPAGLLFGWIGLRLNSIWYVALLHWLVGVSMDWFILTSP